jgi:hypothetical protein
MNYNCNCKENVHSTTARNYSATEVSQRWNEIVFKFQKSRALYNEDHANILKSEMNKNKSLWERLYTYYVNATLNTKTVY